VRRVIAADTRGGISTLAKILGGYVQLIPAVSLEQALKKIEDGADLVVCGIHFDQSRMFGFLGMAKARPASRAVPFVCYRDMPSDLSATLIQELGCRVQGLGRGRVPRSA